MTRLSGISGRRAVKAFERAGFRAGKSLNGHIPLSKSPGQIVILPLERELAPYLLRAQIQRAGLQEKEFLAFLPRMVLGNVLVIG